VIVLIPYQPLVLCIDDYRPGLLLRKSLLESHGFAVLTAGDGPAGLSIVKRASVDVVVLDYQMPLMDGEAVARQLRCDHREIPILLLSGVVSGLPESLLSMCDEFVAKAESPEKMVEAVEKLTGVRELVLKHSSAMRFSEPSLVNPGA
jgi:CheY-like chemotaxis protein